MTGMLASVKNLTEALQVARLKVDIIDLKQPEQGALGALSVSEVQEIVATLDETQVISATVGDLPMHADLVFDAVKAMAATGVNYVKIGFFPEGDTLATIEKLAKFKQQSIALIAVLFADTQPDLKLLDALKIAGFQGVMLDTMDKRHGSLTDVMTVEQLKFFVNKAKDLNLLSGLAGSLKQTNINDLLKLEADYLGFRGALCQQQNRVSKLDSEAIKIIYHAVKSPLLT